MASIFNNAKVFSNEDEDNMKEFLEELDRKDIRSENIISESELVALPNAKILVKDIMAQHGVADTSENERAFLEAMDTTGVLWKGPVNGKLRILPVAEQAIPSLCDRAGLYGPSTKLKPLVLNDGFELYNNMAKTLVRGGKLMASHSLQYEWLPQGELFKTLQEGLTLQFGSYKFVEGFYSDDITMARFSLPEKKETLLHFYNEKAKQLGEMDVQDAMPEILFLTNDVAKSSAAIHPVIRFKNGTAMRIGSPLKVEHDSHHSVGDFALKCEELMVAIKEQTDKLMDLMDIELKYPEDAFKNASKKAKLPSKAATSAFEDFTIRRGARVSAHSIYLALFNAIGYIENPTVNEVMNLEEQISRLIYADWSALDRPL